jgi:hypothetical protein
LLIEELPGFGIPRIQAVVVDEKGLVLKPVAPAVLADLLMDALAQGIPEGSLLQHGCFLLTTAALNRIHLGPLLG